MDRVERIIEAHGTGLLATVGDDEGPRVRWLTPRCCVEGPEAIYALTRRPGFAKVGQARARPRVEWMFQTPSLDEVITLRGRINVVENPSMRAEALEVIGPRLRAFWKLAHDERDLAVLETVIEEATRYLPMQGRKDTVRFGPGGGQRREEGKGFPAADAPHPPVRGEGRADVRPAQDRRLLPPVHRPGGRRPSGRSPPWTSAKDYVADRLPRPRPRPGLRHGPEVPHGRAVRQGHRLLAGQGRLHAPLRRRPAHVSAATASSAPTSPWPRGWR